MIVVSRVKLIIASYGQSVPGALLLDKEDVQALSEEAPGGMIERDDYAWRVASIEIEEYTSESGIVAVTLEPIVTTA